MRQNDDENDDYECEFFSIAKLLQICRSMRLKDFSKCKFFSRKIDGFIQNKLNFTKWLEVANLL